MINECLDADTPKYNILCIHVTHRFNVHSFSCVSISIPTFDIFALLRGNARSQILTRSIFPAIKTSIAVHSPKVNNHHEVITGPDARGCALGRSTLGPMFHETESST
jgi:hypothetical protein